MKQDVVVHKPIRAGNTNGDQDNDGVIDILDECPDM